MTLEQMLLRLLDDRFTVRIECEERGSWRDFTCTLQRGPLQWSHQSADYPRSAMGAVRGALKKVMIDTGNARSLFEDASKLLDESEAP